MNASHWGYGRSLGYLGKSNNSIPSCKLGWNWANTYKSLNELLNMYLRMIYSCPPSTQEARQACWTLKVAFEKVSLVARILHSSQEEENLGRKVLKVQLAIGWPGLTKEVKEICRKVGLPNVTKEYIYRKKIYEYIQLYDMKVMKENMHQDKYINIRNISFLHRSSKMGKKCGWMLDNNFFGTSYNFPLSIDFRTICFFFLIANLFGPT